MAERGYFAAQSTSAQAIQLDSAGTMPMLRTNQAPPPPISCAQLGQIKAPVVIARGERTRPLFRLIADAAAACIPTQRHAIVPGATHMWPGEDPVGFSKAVIEFLKDK